ncbi:hypothetical protein GE061_001389 [Apolygus lucorum]|uniref:FP protein C-terminal domain-containing protein n=1 Tax=Apolygus lucorum TaxID=248454 RepID=A0A6A4J1J9_APOLU|nr:hypothetical protein GE061_001389 [Apolygus lucorum]
MKWRCDRCVKGGNDSRGALKADVDEDDRSDDSENERGDGDELEEVAAIELNKKMDRVLQGMKSLKTNTEKSLNFNSDKLDEVLNKISALETTVKNLSKANDRLIRENRELNAKVDDLTARVNRFDQALIEKEIELTGFPETPGEDPKSVIVKVACCLDCKLETSDIEFAYRVRPKSPSGDRRLIVAKFASLENKKKVLSSYRLKKGIQLTAVLPDHPKEQRLYFNDRLTLYNKRLLWLAKQVAREYNYAYVWSREGDILMKKDEQSRPIRIPSPQMLQRMDKNMKLADLFGTTPGEE